MAPRRGTTWINCILHFQPMPFGSIIGLAWQNQQPCFLRLVLFQHPSPSWLGELQHCLGGVEAAELLLDFVKRAASICILLGYHHFTVIIHPNVQVSTLNVWHKFPFGKELPSSPPPLSPSDRCCGLLSLSSERGQILGLVLTKTQYVLDIGLGNRFLVGFLRVSLQLLLHQLCHFVHCRHQHVRLWLDHVAKQAYKLPLT
mmetsp:Transcript_12298/g.28788  ORF Transcript_12298/g.28788 Transcript_12298/m.28788 type:complete len:201 (-) Transcript_12298:2775-3377(-)